MDRRHRLWLHIGLLHFSIADSPLSLFVARKMKIKLILEKDFLDRREFRSPIELPRSDIVRPIGFFADIFSSLLLLVTMMIE